MRYSRRKFTEQFIDFTDRIHIGDTKAFYFDISAEDVILFLLKQTYKSLIFFLRLRIFFVWLAVPSKPSSQPIWLKVEEKERKLCKQQKSSSHQLRKRGHLGRKAPSPEFYCLSMTSSHKGHSPCSVHLHDGINPL